MADILPLLRTHGSILNISGGSFLLQELFRRVNSDVAEINKLSDATAIIRGRQIQIHRLSLISSALAPIRKLPNEIISEIFVFYHDSCDGSEELPPYRLFTQVCWSWRAVARSTAGLWTKFVWCPTALGLVDYPRSIGPWFKNGCTLPMDVAIRDINLGVHFVKASPPELQTILRPMIPFLYRCRVLELSMPLSSLLPLFTLDKPFLPNLERLVLDITDGCKALESPITTFGNSPRLRNVVLRSGVEPAFDLLELITLPTSKLTHLDIQQGVALTVTSILDIITACKCLKVAFFYLPKEYDQDLLLPATTITLLQLHLLVLDFDDPRTAMQVLASVTLPSLSELHLSQKTPFSRFYSVGRCLIELQRRSAFELTRLHMHAVNSVSCDELLLLLGGTTRRSAVVSLDIDRCLGIAVKEFADALLYEKDAETNMLPLLTNLRFLSMVDSEMDASELWAAVKSRWGEDPTEPSSELLDEGHFCTLKEVCILLHDLVKRRDIHLNLPDPKGSTWGLICFEHC